MEIVGTNTARPVALRRLGDLQGAVNIKTESDALEYVRLLTSPSTWFLWHGRQSVEVVRDSAAANLPTFGLKAHDTFRNGSHNPSGFMGILSTTAFKQGKFESVSVTVTRDGFTVKRWLLEVGGSKKTVEQVKETVGQTGAYKRVVLQSKAAPQLPGTNWYIITFE